MAKGQKKSNKEIRKPKQKAPKAAPATPGSKFIGGGSLGGGGR